MIAKYNPCPYGMRWTTQGDASLINMHRYQPIMHAINHAQLHICMQIPQADYSATHLQGYDLLMGGTDNNIFVYNSSPHILNYFETWMYVCICYHSVGCNSSLQKNKDLFKSDAEYHVRWCSGDANMMTSSNGNIIRVTGHLCGEFTGHR